MNAKQITGLLILAGTAIIVLGALGEAARTRTEERSVRQKILDEVGLDVAAVHRATDVVNDQIERGVIRDWDTLNQRVHDEIAFQKIAIRED